MRFGWNSAQGIWIFGTLVALAVSGCEVFNGGQCEAAAVCDGDDEQVQTCPPGASCYEVSICGHTITCQEVEANCEALPHCEADEVEVETCDPAGNAPCREVTLCGTTILCEGQGNCGAIPTCGDGFHEVPACSDNGIPCQEVTLCGATISCEQDVTCTAEPVCDDGWHQVEDCLDNGSPCEYVELCGKTIACMPDE